MGSDVAPDSRTWRLWGKADPKFAGTGAPEWHPLLCHVLDVVACARSLFLDVRPDRLDSLAAAIALPRGAALPWLLFFVALHDLGKATPPFQFHKRAQARHAAIAALGLDSTSSDEPHGELSVSLATRVLADRGVPPRLARWVARAVGAHHGQFVSLEKLQKKLELEKGRLAPEHQGRAPLWAILRSELVDAVGRACGIVAGAMPPSLPGDPAKLHSFVADLAGFTTVADWLGSNAEIFHYVEPPGSVAEYVVLSRARAADVLAAVGWRRPPRPAGRTFQELFAPKTPWPLHDAVAVLSPKLDGASLIIVEAPMGEGKTEAALLLYEALAARGATGLYFALPTQATSNQILGRVELFLESAYPGEVHELHLVHGNAGLSERYEHLKERAFSVRSVDGPARGEGGAVADAWFSRSKRALLAPVAVGTVDQALLGVLGVRHAFLRLHALAGKVVVIDEVHAYDTYTSGLLARLLAWLRALGTTVVLLSATLPASRRAVLTRAFGGTAPAPCPYPRLTTVTGGRSFTETFLPKREPKSVRVRWHDRATLPEALATRLERGGCVAWIVNTVRAAQQTYRTLGRLKADGVIPEGVAIDLIHARFPFDARAARELAAERQFGPDGAGRPRAAILVGTQVLEQSLDLDFDLMITELAPVDLVLQRAGRLHRHGRPRELRGAFPEPELWILRPDDEDGASGPSFGVSRFIYAESVLLRSWLALRARDTILLPTDIEPLIEAVYEGTPSAPSPEVAARLVDLDAKEAEKQRDQMRQAELVVLPAPDGDDPFAVLAAARDDEDPAVHISLRAVTRLGDPTVDVVPVLRRGDRAALAGDPAVILDLGAKDVLPRALVLAAARQAVSLSRWGVVQALIQEKVPAAFQASGHLRFHRALYLDDDGRTVVAGVPIHLDPELGLVVGHLDDPTAKDEETPA